MKKISKLLSLLLAMIMALSLLAACGGGDDNPDNPDNPDVPQVADWPEYPENPGTVETLKFYLWCNDALDTNGMPVGFKDVIDYYNTNYANRLGVKLEFKFATLDEYKTKINLDFASGSMSYDVIFDADWINLTDFSKKGYYYNLESDFAGASATSGLKKGFPDAYRNSNEFAGGLYGVPMTQNFGSIAITYIRKDWRVRCSEDTTWQVPSVINTTKKTSDLANGIDDHAELQIYLYWLKDHKGESWTKNGVNYKIPENAVPYAADKSGTYSPYEVISTQNTTKLKAKDYNNAGIKTDMQINTNSLVATSYIKGGEVMAASLNNENPTATNGKKDYPQGFNQEDPSWQDYYTEARRWYTDGLIDNDVMSVDSGWNNFTAGTAGAAMYGLDTFNSNEAAVKAANAGAELEIYVQDKSARDKEMGMVATDFKAWNFLCVPKQTSVVKKNAFLKLLNWMYYRQENADLFNYGIKGTHWQEAKDENGQSIAKTITTNFAGVKQYAFPAYLLGWNPNYTRSVYASDPKVMEYTIYQNDINRFVPKIYSEFSFDKTATKDLETALKNPDIDKAHSSLTSYKLGLVADPIASWNAVLQAQYSNAALQSSLDIVRIELMKQLQAYIDGLS